MCPRPALCEPETSTEPKRLSEKKQETLATSAEARFCSQSQRQSEKHVVHSDRMLPDGRLVDEWAVHAPFFF